MAPYEHETERILVIWLLFYFLFTLLIQAFYEAFTTQFNMYFGSFRSEGGICGPHTFETLL